VKHLVKERSLFVFDAAKVRQKAKPRK